MLKALVGKKMDNMHKKFRNFSRKLKNIVPKSNVNARNEKKKSNRDEVYLSWANEYI